MLRVEFEYRDEYSNGKWIKQECIVSSLKECKEIYGLDYCEYRIIKIEEI